MAMKAHRRARLDDIPKPTVISRGLFFFLLIRAPLVTMRDDVHQSVQSLGRPRPAGHTAWHAAIADAASDSAFHYCTHQIGHEQDGMRNIARRQARPL